MVFQFIQIETLMHHVSTVCKPHFE
uniref:Uncharacterized protein n=1 Tax=Rhizophora mucronata TaxID=61149 RepID=A0A2P2IU23_RHIMU